MEDEGGRKTFINDKWETWRAAKKKLPCKCMYNATFDFFDFGVISTSAAVHLSHLICSLQGDVSRRLAVHTWPGNAIYCLLAGFI